MIMQMLAAGGLPVLTDERRTADDDNPLGYFEFEPVKRLHENSDWLADAAGRAVKVVVPLLPYLPRERHIRIVLVDRDLDEVLDSQRQMLVRRRERIGRIRRAARCNQLREAYARQLENLHATLRERPRTRALLLNHAEVIAVPRTAAAAINAFLGGGLNEAAMELAVKPQLHRQHRVPR